MTKRIVFGLPVALLVLAGAPALARVDPGDLCKEKKAKAAGLKTFLLLKAFGKNIKKPNVAKFNPDVSKARSKFQKGFSAAERPGECVLEGDSGDVEQVVDVCVEDLIRLITESTTTSTTITPGSTTSTTTTTLPPVCGDAAITGYEQCEPSDLGGATCGSLGFNLDGTLGCTGECLYDISSCQCQAVPATGQTSCWNSAGTNVPCSSTGQDGDTLSGEPLAYVDNGDGTITDLNTGLMWAKKTDDGTIHDKDNVYTWDQAFTVHVAGLSSASFAGYTDWRVPNVKELDGIINYEVPGPAPAVDASAFDVNCTIGCTVATCSCTKSDYYWSSTSASNSPTWVWAGNFNGGGITGRPKGGTPYHVRAVRGP